jgi:hypothetical protein
MSPRTSSSLISWRVIREVVVRREDREEEGELEEEVEEVGDSGPEGPEVSLYPPVGFLEHVTSERSEYFASDVEKYYPGFGETRTHVVYGNVHDMRIRQLQAWSIVTMLRMLAPARAIAADVLAEQARMNIDLQIERGHAAHLMEHVAPMASSAAGASLGAGKPRRRGLLGRLGL